MLRHVELSVGRPPVPTWKRPPGRPRAKWTDQLRRDSNNVLVCDSVEASYWSRSLESDATVRADYALTTTTTSIGTCHDLGPSVSACSVTRGGSAALHPDGNRGSSSSADVEGLRDEVAHGRQDVEEDPSLVAARADVDVSHINLLRTGASEHELGGVRRRLEESLEVKASNTVDRLSPAACRRRQPLEAVSSRMPPTQVACRQI